jgi:Transmembrane secretion effector
VLFICFQVNLSALEIRFYLAKCIISICFLCSIFAFHLPFLHSLCEPSINFAYSLELDPAPLERLARFFRWRRSRTRGQSRSRQNGAFSFRVDENLENPGTFRTEMFLSSWAEHTRQLARTTKGEREIVQRALGMHVGDEGPAVRHYLKADRMSTPKDSQCGLVPAPREGVALRRSLQL